MDLRGNLDLLLLSTLAGTGDAHGYALITALREASGGVFDLPEGTVYPALHRLERDGSVSSSWRTEAGRRRRVYALTPSGRTAMAAKNAEWQQFAAGVERVRATPVAPVRRGRPRVAGGLA